MRDDFFFTQDAFLLNFRTVSKTIQKAAAAGLCLRAKLPKAPNKCRSKFVHQITHLYFQSLGNFQHGCQRNFHVSTLNLTNEIVMQVSLFRQLLLGETGLLAAIANFLAQYATVIWLQRHFSFTRP